MLVWGYVFLTKQGKGATTTIEFIRKVVELLVFHPTASLIKEKGRSEKFEIGSK
jgi:hypothetical protein